MLYWCKEYYTGYGQRCQFVRLFSCSGYGVGIGWNAIYSPSMLVTGVKLEEVVLNALLV